ncbi:hypothetical protein [Xanthomonas theicola]|uniref:hypothetical protein n=1 Tax=Xanthomonas theicola TaxID=56464 RepID=UPI000FF8A173|nr:hypothetical protein [Xanthomonas theicola]QNH25177.1 hypothetical protein G4Q83_11125 [Xanthomonas theicola]
MKYAYPFAGQSAASDHAAWIGGLFRPSLADLRQNDPHLQLIREEAAMVMKLEEIHGDVNAFIDKLKVMASPC